MKMRCSAATVLYLAPLVLVAALALSGCTTPSASAQMVPLRSLVLPQPPPPQQIARTPEPQPELAPSPSPLLPFEILPRTSWGATRPIMPRLDPMGQITRITVHHEGVGCAEECSPGEVKAELRKIQRDHKERMFADIGYHFIVDYNGRVWEGRSLRYQGAHAGDNEANRGNIGVVLLGNFDMQHPSEAQLRSLRTLLAGLMTTYRIPANRVYTHREVKRLYGLPSTDCPGTYLQREVNALRRSLAQAGK